MVWFLRITYFSFFFLCQSHFQVGVLFFIFFFYVSNYFRVFLFRGKIGWMENFEKKIGRKTFLRVFGWVERKENKWWNLSVFSLGPPKSFLSKMERKLKGEIGHHFWMTMSMYNCTFTHVAFLHTFFFLCCLPLFFFFLFF